jgi:hypothetical protein
MNSIDDKRKFAVYMALLGTAFGEKGIGSHRIEVYWEYLKDLRIEDIGQAVDFLLKNRKYPSIPTIAEIREAVLGRDEEFEDAALNAWSAVCVATERGQYLISDQVANEAVKTAFGSWEKFGAMSPETEMADRPHFIRVYKSIARSRREKGLPILAVDPDTFKKLAGWGGKK